MVQSVICTHSSQIFTLHKLLLTFMHRDLISNFFNNGLKILKLIVRVRIYKMYHDTSRKKIVDLKTGFLRFFSVGFIEVKRTIPRL